MHISVCVCTFHRPELLARLLNGLCKQSPKGEFSYSIVVADNDYLESARSTVNDIAGRTAIQMTYCVEATKSISLARNRALEHAKGDLIAFIDDDEVPPTNWLFLLSKALIDYEASGIFGPVRPYFDSEPPLWIIKGSFFNRPEHPTGYIMPWQECRAGNVLIRKGIIEDMSTVFDPKFGANAEDIDLFRRLKDAGHRFIWCNEASVDEVVSPNRWKRSFMINRALLRGKTSLLHPGQRLRSVLKSLVAVPAYGLALPFLQLLGHHYFMKYLVKLFDHLGKLLALIGLNPVHERKM